MNSYAKIFPIFESLLVNHIATKASYPLLHEHTEKAYELAFDCFHQIGEKMQDLELKDPLDDEDAVKQAYKDIEELKNVLYAMIKEKNSVGMDNLLRGLADKAEFICGDLRWFIAQEADEYENKPILPTKK
jgi:hypothetical protein